MSIDTWVKAASFNFTDKDKAVDLVKNYDFNYSYEGLDKATTIEEVFSAWEFNLKHHETGVYYITSSGDCPGDEEELFIAISPCIQTGGEIEIGIEFGEAPGDIVKVYKFNGTGCDIEQLYEEEDFDTEEITRRPFNEEEFF